MIVDLIFEDIYDSNIFLRALWANISKEYGKCVWQYTPYKDSSKHIIFLGNMDIDLPSCFSVYVHYKKKAVINKMEFLELNNKEVSQEIKEKFQEIIKETVISFKTPEIKCLNATISSYNSISNYNSDFFSISSYGNGLSSFTLGVKAFGDNDAKFICQSKMTKVLDLLSVLTNAPFSFCKQPSNPVTHKEKEMFYEDEGFIDGHPIQNSEFILTKYGKEIIDRVIRSDKEEGNIKKLINASMHFHAARKFDAQINDLYIYHEPEQTEEVDIYTINFSPRDQRLFSAREVNANIEEIATVSYISALEVISSIVFDNDAHRCKNCNQFMYGISARVRDLLRKYFPDQLAKQIHSYYSSRSKFLHEGEILEHTYTGISIPQLDYNHSSGCKVSSDIPLINLREYTGYCIRSVIKEYLVK